MSNNVIGCENHEEVIDVVVEMSVTINNPSQNFIHGDYAISSRGVSSKVFQ